ncbi:MAG: tRNA (adenosine(37)-N6)-threonylcarbamoyltransferase complex ATPase subunit type 1 TsaE [Akkermansiaceae bacterium]|nr:tRNA (adenosine(37)-N6)-threonylcarbamoyltransferase complex ATPase subunit type 1 TsaE [Akkermansiaceae bacterium]
MTLKAANEEEMIGIGRQCARQAVDGSVFILSGDLGAGKTHWTKGLVAGLGSPASVTSPTFGLVHEYTGGSLPVFHFDFYRLESAEELITIGWDDYLEREGVTVIEWGERFAELIPAGATWVRIRTLEDGSREIELTTFDTG